MKKVRKAIIPAAGLGTRFLPATKAMPKEMLPIVDKPTIQYIVEEAIESGVEDIIVVTGKGKRAIEDHFDIAFELEHILEQKGKFDILEKVRKSSNVNLHYIRQKEAKGLGHAVWCARNFIGDEPFAVLLGDDIVEAETPCTRQLIEQYERTGRSVIGVQMVGVDQTHRYGIVDPGQRVDNLYEVNSFVEKPPQGQAPSNLAIMGRYVLTPDIFEYLGRHERGAGGEIQLTDAIQKLNMDQGVYAFDFQGTRYDVGEQLGFIMTTLDFALRNNELKYKLMTELEELMERELSKQLLSGRSDRR
ncbi:UTP--glucose-1-phosphate uridylyltransferase GalU [Paenibacillus sp. PL91]|jgi:UTP--glucose-1-phosphate uridylyltransferase|uniref:UTP--glucose-1-phosphate uridylyltransferase GalU n=1 Tax=Paenibacillus sp. PL91 TaxID=2729538 RepID=UPI00145E67E2|nr:UTP--glucose-1-phosphate uridylyltransferase GalU [Paenibacillus sp. PL91]MBC9202212.1 UTP--glucose-1-phosphate uridylyltransferase GalU [Paenibacillus sp. PL91]